MSKYFESIKQGLEEAIDFSKGKAGKARVHQLKPIDVKKIRTSINMTQEQFASSFGMSVATLRHWERGDRVPSGTAMVLLNIVSKKPDMVLEALSV
jgi:putative transcriptional regulator